MSTLLVALACFVGYFIAYHTYGRWIARKIFALDPEATVPSRQLQDGVDFVPTRKEVIFGHHFTSIAGTGPIVGPAIAVFWGWLPALIWVLFGCIFIGAVHDFGALVISLRNRGQTVGDIAGRMIAPRARVLFLLILSLALTVVLAIFGLVIAVIFSMYPETVLSVWVAMPLAVAIGYWVNYRGRPLLVPSLLALAAMYGAICLGVYYCQIDLTDLFGIQAYNAKDVEPHFFNTVVVWTLVLLAYCFIASVLPVWMLLQPRDYINSHQLLLALGLLILGLFAAGLSGKADIVASAPAVAEKLPADAPPIWPFLFITIACGAVSGFHCLVSSGTSSKQLACETDAQYVGYGSMLLEGTLAVLVIIACCAGVGMGRFERDETTGPSYSYVAATEADGTQLTGRAAWNARYDASKGWSSFTLPPKIGAFVEGGANFLTEIGIPLKLAIGILAVLVASFAATTLDTATRLQRYVIQELAATLHAGPLTNKYLATALAVAVGGAVALFAGEKPGGGGMILWPLFGAINQLLAGLALMVLVFYLWRRSKPVAFALVPMIIMLILPGWAMLWNLFNQQTGWLGERKWLLFGVGVGVLALQVWMIVEAAIVWRRSRGVIEAALPPLESNPNEGGRAC